MYILKRQSKKNSEFSSNFHPVIQNVHQYKENSSNWCTSRFETLEKICDDKIDATTKWQPQQLSYGFFSIIRRNNNIDQQ